MGSNLPGGNMDTLKIQTNREAGIDLFRCLGLLFVNGLHSFLYNGFYYLPQEGMWVWLANSVRWLFYGCNGMFMLMTGYLKSDKPWNKHYYKGLLTVIVGYLLTCVISYPIRYFFLGEKDALGVWVQRLLTFSNYAWYVEMYIGLILVSPFINLAFARITDRRGILALTGSMILVSALPTAFTISGPDGGYSLFPDYWKSLYPITLYVIGAAIKRLRPKVPAWGGIGGACLIAMGLGFVSMLTATDGFSSGFTQGYGGFWVTLMVTSLFLGIYRLPVGGKFGKLLGWISGGVFEGFILSRLLDVWVYGLVPQWHTPQMYPVIFLCITTGVFVISLLAGKCVHTLAVKIVKKRG